MTDWKEIRESIAMGEIFKELPEGTEIYPVVGLTFVPGYPDNIHSIRKTMEVLQEEIPINLIRNPNNQYDSNAIEVRLFQQMLGHLPKEVAAELAPQMDAGKMYKATVYRVRVSPENPNNPGMDILLEEEFNG